MAYEKASHIEVLVRKRVRQLWQTRLNCVTDRTLDDRTACLFIRHDIISY